MHGCGEFVAALGPMSNTLNGRMRHLLRSLSKSTAREYASDFLFWCKQCLTLESLTRYLIHPVEDGRIEALPSTEP